METIIHKKSLADEVAINLQQQIAAGKFNIGDKLPTEPALMKAFGVGRSSIREAIKILSNQGLLKVQQGVGTFVASQVSLAEPLNQRLKRADIKDLDEVRKLLEIKIAQKAAMNHEAKDIEKMEAYLALRNTAAKAGDLSAAIQADIHFHITIAQAAKNDILLDLYKATAAHMEAWFMRIYRDTNAFVETQLLHEALLEHIINRDAKQAWNTALAIIDHV